MQAWGPLLLASLQSCTVHLSFQQMQEFRRSGHCLVFGVCISWAYCSKFCWQMSWCCGVDRFCVLLVSMALGSRTRTPHQDSNPTAEPNPHTRTQSLHHAPASFNFLALQPVYLLHIFPESFTAKEIQRTDIDCLQPVLSFSFLYLSCTLYCKQDSEKR